MHVNLPAMPHYSLVQEIPASKAVLHHLCTHGHAPPPIHVPSTSGESQMQDSPWVRGAGRTGSCHVSHLLWGKRSLWDGKIEILAVPDSTGAHGDTCICTREALRNYGDVRSADIIATFIQSRAKCRQREFATDGSELNQTCN